LRLSLERPCTTLVFLAILCTIFFSNILFSGFEKIVAGHDIVVHHYYARVFARESLLKGLLPKWNPYEYAGMPFAADPGNCVFYPLNKLFLVMPVAKAIGLNMVFHVLLAGAGMLLLARSLGMQRTGGLIAAVTFMFSGYFIDRISVGQETLVMCSAYVPWIFFCYEKGRDNGLIWSLLGGVLVGLQILTGAFHLVLCTAIFVFVYCIARTLQGSSGTRLKALLDGMCCLLVMGGVGVALSAVQTIPSIELILNGVRAQAPSEFVSAFSFPPKNFIHFLLPHLNVGAARSTVEYACYVGVLPLALALSGLASLKEPQERAMAAVAIVALAVMLGACTPLFSVLLRIAPGLNLFRIHVTAVVGILMVSAVLAGFAWERIFYAPAAESRKMRGRMACITGAFFIVIAVAAVLYWSGKLMLTVDSPAPSAPFGFFVAKRASISSLWHPMAFLPIAAVCVTFVASLLLRSTCDTGMKYMLIGLTIADLYVMSTGRIRMMDVDYLTRDDKLIQSVKSDPADEPFRVWFPQDIFFGSRAKLFGLFDVNGHNALGIRVFEEYLTALTGIRPVRKPPDYEMDERIFMEESFFVNNILNVKYFSIQRGSDDLAFYRADSFFPRAFYVSDYILGSPEEFLASGIDPEAMVMLHEQPPVAPEPPGVHSLDAARVAITAYRNDEIELSVVAPSDGFVVLSEVYYPGWQAEVDGAPTPVLRGDFLLRVVPMTQGVHRVKLFFAPRSLFVGIVISSLTLISVALALLYLRLSLKRRPPAAAHEFSHYFEDDATNAQR